MADSGKVNIHGKEYTTVAARVQTFREKHGNQCSIVTEIVSANDEVVIMMATILFEGTVVATGHAEERRSSSQINRTSALENAETSAIGRALAAFGMAGTEFASADEVATAITQQKAPTKPTGTLATDFQRTQIRAFAKAMGMEAEDIPKYLAEYHGIEDHTKMTSAQAKEVMEEMK